MKAVAYAVVLPAMILCGMAPVVIAHEVGAFGFCLGGGRACPGCWPAVLRLLFRETGTPVMEAPLPGEVFELDVVLDTKVALVGWSFGVEHGREVRVEQVTAPVRDALMFNPGDFFAFDSAPGNGSGFYVAYVTDLDDKNGFRFLPTGRHVIARARCRMSARCRTEFRLTNDLGDPPVEITLNDTTGHCAHPSAIGNALLESSSVEGCTEFCYDGLDNDGDDLTDCADPDCPSPSAREICDNGRDDDCDGRADCRDDDCHRGSIASSERCSVSDSGELQHCVHGVSRCRQVNPGEGAGGGDCLESEMKLDAWMTAAGAEEAMSCHVFGIGELEDIPASFFAVASEPFAGVVCFRGEPLGEALGLMWERADTLIRRAADPFDDCEMPSSEERVIAIEVAALNLRSVAPISVRIAGISTQWDVSASLSDLPQEPGTIRIRKERCSGGTWDAAFTVLLKYTFSKVGEPGEIRVLDRGQLGLPAIRLTSGSQLWVSRLPADLEVENGFCTSFYPGIEDSSGGGDCKDCNGNGRRDSCDLADGVSRDCDGNLVPDECQPDGDGDGVPDVCGGRRVPGDCNQDLSLDVSDAVCVFGFLFLGSPWALPCGDGSAAHAANLALVDWQPDGRADISDGVAILSFLFTGGPSHPSGTACAAIVGCSERCSP